MNEDLAILLVEDNRVVLRIYTKFLTGLGFHNIIGAEDGNAALEILKSRHVDVILADIQIPEPNGLKLLEWVRANETTKDVPFLMVTGESQEAIVRKVMEMGANCYIIKPLTLATLKKKLERILSGTS